MNTVRDYTRSPSSKPAGRRTTLRAAAKANPADIRAREARSVENALAKREAKALALAAVEPTTQRSAIRKLNRVAQTMDWLAGYRGCQGLAVAADVLMQAATKLSRDDVDAIPVLRLIAEFCRGAIERAALELSTKDIVACQLDTASAWLLRPRVVAWAA